VALSASYGAYYVAARTDGVVEHLSDFRYPLGEFRYTGLSSAEHCAERVQIIELFPAELRRAVSDLTDGQLDTPHRESGWTIRQITHHLGDVNVHIYCRVKAVVAEPAPLIVGFEESDWIKTPDHNLPVAPTLAMLEGTHARWTAVLRPLLPADYARTFEWHGEGRVSLDEQVEYAAWHCQHHLAQIAAAQKRFGW
jgi:uncharacterized damage-inducible protein DinB